MLPLEPILRTILRRQKRTRLWFWGHPFLAQVSSSAKWVDKRRKAVRKHFYSNKSFQISDVLLIPTRMPIPAKRDPDTVKNKKVIAGSPSSGQECGLLE